MRGVLTAFKATRSPSKESRFAPTLNRRGLILVEMNALASTLARGQASDFGALQIAWRLHWNRRRFDKWLKWGAVPERSRMEPRPLSAESFREYLWERWTGGCRNGRASG